MRILIRQSIKEKQLDAFNQKFQIEISNGILNTIKMKKIKKTERSLTL